MSDKQIDEITGVSTTGHEWDGIKELDNPMPRWWLYTYYASVVFAIGYMIAYPAWPMINTATKGILGYSTRAELRTQLDVVEASKAGYLEQIAAKSVDEVIADHELRIFAEAAGAAAFRVNCVQCHGSGAQGSPGYPNLNDDDWLWGGSPEEIRATIAHGVRFEDDADTHYSEMPSFTGMLEPVEIRQVANYTAALSGQEVDLSGPELAAGGQNFLDYCASCHGETGEGSLDFGAPNLRDAISLYGASVTDIAAQIRNPKHGVMPGWETRLGETMVKELAVYVHSLGGGE